MENLEPIRTERINIFFHGLFSKEEKAKIKADISYHMGPGPSDACLCCCVFNEEEGFSCNLRVHSATGHLYFHRQSQDLYKALNFVYDSMERAFRNWHRDKQLFSKKHPLTASPCYSYNFKEIECPLHHYCK